MAIEVRIPTILRTYTGGEKAVDATGATLTDLIENLEANHPGIGERLLENGELLSLYKQMWANDEEPVVIYHSHTATEAYPSRTDIGLAMEPNAHYVLVSTRGCGNSDGPVEFRSYRIVGGDVTEEDVDVASGPAPEPVPEAPARSEH